MSNSSSLDNNHHDEYKLGMNILDENKKPSQVKG